MFQPEPVNEVGGHGENSTLNKQLVKTQKSTLIPAPPVESCPQLLFKITM